MSNSLQPPWTVAPTPDSSVQGIFQAEDWSGWPFPTPGAEWFLKPFDVISGAPKSSCIPVLYVSEQKRITVGWAKGCHTPKNLLGYSFVIKGKVGRVRTSLSFLSRHASIISSSLARLPSGKTGIITVFRTYLIGWLWGLNWVTTCKILRKVPGTLKAASE